jgi:protein ImuA
MANRSPLPGLVALSRSDPGAAGPALHLGADARLSLMRVHEACGPARRTLAIWLAGLTQGPVIWIAPDRQPDAPNPDGMMAFADPARFLFVAPRRDTDLLWCAEEVLRAGAVALMVADLPGPPGLTAVRRMHLAAEAGARHAATPPLGLLLTPGDGGAPGVETRWYMAPAHAGDARRWRLERRRARMQPPMAWEATQTGPRRGLDLVRAKAGDGGEPPPTGRTGMDALAVANPNTSL